ncbi:MAG: hypothetical protein LBH04_11665 [Tannerellaceae bacterium]|jgi:hypothetical protein|nr:hypothetical protein [Tannerellaceae bacterium]
MNKILRKGGVIIFLSWLTLQIFAQSSIVINPDGGTTLDDGLKTLIKPTGTIHVYRDNQTQYYPGYTWGGVNGQTQEYSSVQTRFRFSCGSSYNQSFVEYSTCSTTPPVLLSTGEWAASMTGKLVSPFSNGIFYVTMNFTYKYPERYFAVDYYVRAPSDLTTPETVHIYLDHDAYILGFDQSRGYQVTNGTGHFVGDYRIVGDSPVNCNQGSPHNNNLKNPSTHGFKTDGAGFRSYFSGYYSNRTSNMTADNKLSNVVEDKCQDDGIAVEFVTGPLSAGQIGVRRVLHCYGNSKGEFDNMYVGTPPSPISLSSPVSVNFTSATYNEIEGNTTHDANNIKITVSAGVLAQDQIVNFTITPGTAAINTDYTYQKGFIIPAGNYTTPQTLTLNNIHIVGNTTCQSSRTFNIVIDEEDCNDLIRKGTVYQATVTINDDDNSSVNQPTDMGPYCAGTTVPAVTFTGTNASGFTWTNNNTAIGLAASGTGNLPSFTATNSTASEITATITVTPTTTGCAGVSKSFTIKVYPALAGGTIGANQSICGGSVPAPFTNVASASGGNSSAAYTYQWQKSTTSATDGFSNIGGATNATFTESATLTQTTYYRRQASNCNDTKSSNTITVTVYPALTGGTIGSNQSICNGATPAAFTSSAGASGGNTGAAYSYQWQKSTTSATEGFANISGATSVTFTETTALTQTTYYRRIVNNCNEAQSNTITVSVYPALAGGTVGSDQSICSGSIPAAFTSSAGASGGNTSVAYSYQWQKSTTSSTEGFANISGATNATFAETVALTQTTYYRRQVSNCSGTVSSNSITVTVNPLPVLDAINNIAVDAGSTVGPITFSGSSIGASTTWSGTVETIGMGISGTGTSISAFTAQNATNAPLVNTVTVTPKSTSLCTGLPITFTITVYPRLASPNTTNTVQEYTMVEHNPFANAYIPADAYANLRNLADSVVGTGPRAGEVFSIGTGTAARIVYRHTGYNPVTRASDNLFPNSVDSFTIRIRAKQAVGNQVTELNTKVYIYVLRSNQANSDCQGVLHQTTLKTIPTGGVNFYWYNTSGADLGSNPTATRTLSSPSTSMIQPVFSSGYYASYTFPQGKFDISSAGTSSSPVSMRWTGQIDSQWNNPGNWVVVNGSSSTPAQFAPTACTNVTIPSPANVQTYPELTDVATCGTITMNNRAMLKNPHLLTHSSAAVEIKLDGTEYDRFLLWSAPLHGMTSADYGYKVNGVMQRGDLRMNLFQQKNPLGGTTTAMANQFTATFAALDQTLEVGRAFNLKVTGTGVTKNGLLSFAKNTKLITSDLVANGSGKYNLPVIQGAAPSYANNGYALLQVVNPYMAYLDFSKFYADNNGVINSGYYTWNGDTKDGFISQTLIQDASGNRYLSTGSYTATTGLIAPLQSFFVAKLYPSNNVSSLVISPEHTTTKDATNPNGSYLLRSSVAAGGILNLTVSQEDRKAYAALVYSPSASHAMEREDMPALSSDENPLSVYTFSAMNDALAINSNGYFGQQPVKLGIIAPSNGEIKLTFANSETFGHKVALVDRLLNKRIDINSTSEYTFTTSKAGEINDRFTLEISYTGQGITYTGAEALQRPSFIVTAASGSIIMRSGGDLIRSVEIHDMLGRLIYRENEMNVAERQVRLNSLQLYIVKAKVGGEMFVEKVLLKQ